MNTSDAKRVLETALICAQQPISVKDLGALFQDQLGLDTIKTLLADLQLDWAQRGAESVQVASGWRFQSRPEMRVFLDRLHPEKPPKYSRAALETLAIIAYNQPITKPQIETIRGVNCDGVMNTLEARGLIGELGRADTVGHPMRYGVSFEFLQYFGLKGTHELPAVQHAEVLPSAAQPPTPNADA